MQPPWTFSVHRVIDAMQGRASAQSLLLRSLEGDGDEGYAYASSAALVCCFLREMCRGNHDEGSTRVL
jgi:hypothetical protein